MKKFNKNNRSIGFIIFGTAIIILSVLLVIKLIDDGINKHFPIIVVLPIIATLGLLLTGIYIFIYHLKIFNNKIPVGLIILGTLTVIQSIMILFTIINEFINGQNINLKEKLLIIPTFGLLVSGFYIFKKIEWARKMIIISSLIYIIDIIYPLNDFLKVVKSLDILNLIVIFWLITLCVNVVYFMRKDIRIQFVPEKQIPETPNE